MFTSLLLLSGGQQPLDQPDHRGDKVLECVELVRPGVQDEVCEGPHGIKAHLKAGVISNGPVAILKIAFPKKTLVNFTPSLCFPEKPIFATASLWKTGKNSAKTGFMTSAQVSLSTDMEYMARSLCDGSYGRGRGLS